MRLKRRISAQRPSDNPCFRRSEALVDYRLFANRKQLRELGVSAKVVVNLRRCAAVFTAAFQVVFYPLVDDRFQRVEKRRTLFARGVLFVPVLFVCIFFY